MKQHEAQEGIMSSNLFECIFDTLPDGIIVSDRQGKIVQINAAALKLFAVASEALCRGRPYHQFLHQYEMDDEQQDASFARTLAHEPHHTEEGAASSPQEKIKRAPASL